jgi:AraC-like DNA-binding protein
LLLSNIDATETPRLTPEQPVLRLTTDQFPAQDRIAKWREEFGRLLFRLEIEPLEKEQFRADVHLRSLPGLKLMSGMCTPVEFDASAALVANNDDSIGIIKNVDPALVRQLNRESILDIGESMVVSWTDPVTLTLPQGAKGATLVRLSRPVLQALVPGLSDTYGRMLPDIGGALQSLFDYLSVLEDQQAIATPELQHVVVTHIYDLAALALGASRDITEVAKERGLRAARLRAIKEDISARLAESGLSLDSVALRHRVSPRYVQKLFEMEGTSFSDFVRTGRLTRAHRMLQDRRLSHMSISTIAYECGFGDITAFNRAFRKRYSASPSDIRNSSDRE